MNPIKNIHYFNTKENFAAVKLGQTLSSMISMYYYSSSEFVILCIGSDRVTGDSLGPIIGYKLSQTPLERIHIYGTLQSPVHALNLDNTLEEIKRKHPNVPIVAIDASLGNKKHLGFITIGKGSLQPGSGVNKELTAVGDIFITGIVNTSGFLEQMLLQTTRLSIVMDIADCITEAIQLACLSSPQPQKRIFNLFQSLESVPLMEE